MFYYTHKSGLRAPWTSQTEGVGPVNYVPVWVNRCALIFARRLRGGSGLRV